MSGGQSQTYSDLSISSLHSSESLNSVVNPYQQPSTITDLDETVKSPPLKQLRIVERYDEGVFDDGAGSQTEEGENNSGIIADSDDEDEIAHFDSTDNIITNIDNNQQSQLNDDYLTDTKYNRKNSNNKSIEAQTANLGKSFFHATIEVDHFFLDLYDEEAYDNIKTNDNTALRHASEA